MVNSVLKGDFLVVFHGIGRIELDLDVVQWDAMCCGFRFLIGVSGNLMSCNEIQ